MLTDVAMVGGAFIESPDCTLAQGGGSCDCTLDKSHDSARGGGSHDSTRAQGDVRTRPPYFLIGFYIHNAICN